MPAGITKSFRTKLPEFAIIALAKLQVLAIQYVEKRVKEILEELRDKCPSQSKLERLSKTINNIRQTVNTILKKIDKIEKIADYLLPVLVGAQIYILFQKNRIDFLSTPISLPTGAPTGAKRTGKINSISSRLRRFENLVETVEDARFGIKAAANAAKGVFVPIQAILNILDALIQRCASAEGLTEEERESLLANLQTKTQEIYTAGIQYRSTSGKQYTLKIIKDPNSPDIAPKRQAIAQDFRGITVLTGPSSFASDPQVLIEELKFRIENQLP